MRANRLRQRHFACRVAHNSIGSFFQLPAIRQSKYLHLNWISALNKPTIFLLGVSDWFHAAGVACGGEPFMSEADATLNGRDFVLYM